MKYSEMTPEQKSAINFFKEEILSINVKSWDLDFYSKTQIEDYWNSFGTLEAVIRETKNDFIKSVCESVLKYKKASEKQAFCIACELVEMYPEQTAEYAEMANEIKEKDEFKRIQKMIKKEEKRIGRSMTDEEQVEFVNNNK